MPALQTADTFARPPLVSAGSSSSLSSFEHPPPSFQDFIKRTPPVSEDQKPLPPRPLAPRRASISSTSRSRAPSPYVGRRSSSIYSRTVSQWDLDAVSWKNTDLSNDVIPPVPALRPLAYSASTPQLVNKQSAQPRTYSPLIRTPSPTASHITTPASSRKRRLSLFPPRVAPSPVSKKQIQTVSLEEAKAAMHAPGVIHFLPEELRAKTLRRSKSDEALQTGSMGVYPSTTSAFPPNEPRTFLDGEGRGRSVASPRDTMAFTSGYPFPVIDGSLEHVQPLFKVGSGPAPSVDPFYNSSPNTSVHTLGSEELDEPRGRTRQRGPRRLNDANYLTNVAQKLAKEYHHLLSGPYRQPSNSSGYHSRGSDNNIKAYMKIVPRPLFHNKPPAKLPGHGDGVRHTRTGSPSSLSNRTGDSGGTNKLAFRDGEDIEPSTVATWATESHRRRSTSGSIPISPPEPKINSVKPKSIVDTRMRAEKLPLPRRKGNTTRVSAYYPHVASRKGTKPRNITKVSTNRSEHAPMPPLPNDIKQRNVDATRTLAKPALQEQAMSQPSATATASEHSPHLLPSPVKGQEVHLGWSDLAESTFDRIVSPPSSPVKSPTRVETPRFAHIAAPDRLLDESKGALREAEASRRKNSIFGNFLDSWKESKAEKRREELKKSIQLIPPYENSGRT